MRLKRVLAALIIALFNLIDFVESIPYHLSFYGWCAYHFTIGQVVFGFKLWRRNLQAKRALTSMARWQAQPECPPVYEVSSSEYNAQITAAFRTINEELANRGQRVPEKAAIDAIQLISDEYGQQ